MKSITVFFKDLDIEFGTVNCSKAICIIVKERLLEIVIGTLLVVWWYICPFQTIWSLETISKSYLKSCRVNMSFIIETELNNIFLNINVILEQGKLTTSANPKPTSSGWYTHSDSFLPDNYEICAVYTLFNVFCYALTGQCSVQIRTLGKNCKSSSKGYLTVVNYWLFLKVKINTVIIFA